MAQSSKTSTDQDNIISIMCEKVKSRGQVKNAKVKKELNPPHHGLEKLTGAIKVGSHLTSSSHRQSPKCPVLEPGMK